MTEKNVSIQTQKKLFLGQFTWDAIDEPGAYVEVGTGDLYRIPVEALQKGGSPLIKKQSMGASRLVQISKDPYIITEEAKMLCAEYNVHPNF
jgi:hypothetical protein